MSTMPGTLATLASVTPHSSLFQHSDVDKSYETSGGAMRLAEAGLWARRDILIQAHQSWKDRVANITSIVNGDWYRVWPDLTREPSAPTVANTIEMGISHFASIGGSIIPSIRIPVPHKEAGPEGSRGAAKRERRLREIEAHSNISNLLSMWFGDYAGSGAVAGFVWADFSKPAEERNPVIHRLDPRHYYPVNDENGNVIECLVARKVNGYELVRRFPQIKDVIPIDEADIEEWFWFDAERVRHIIADVSPTGRKLSRGLVLVDEENELGVVPVVELKRPSFDGERRGMHDQTVHILRVQHHLMSLTVEKTEEEVYPGIAYYDVEGAETFGPGAVMRYRSEGARFDRFTSQSSFDVKDLIARLEDQARQQSVYPQQLAGEPGASIASGRAIGAAQGALNARLAVAHKQFEWFLEKLSGLVLRFDETYCDGKKTIYGDSHDRSKPETFLPSRDIAGSYEVTRSYGLGAGSDPTNRETRLQMHLAAGLISRSRSREELDFLEDPLDEEKQISKEQMIDAINQGMLAAASQGDTQSALLYFKLLNDPDLTMEEVLIKLFEEQEKAAQAAAAGAAGAGAPPGGGGNPLDALVGAESMASGGGPNAAGQRPGASLPALKGILGEGAPKKVL